MATNEQIHHLNAFEYSKGLSRASDSAKQTVEAACWIVTHPHRLLVANKQRAASYYRTPPSRLEPGSTTETAFRHSHYLAHLRDFDTNFVAETPSTFSESPVVRSLINIRRRRRRLYEAVKLSACGFYHSEKDTKLAVSTIQHPRCWVIQDEQLEAEEAGNSCGELLAHG